MLASPERPVAPVRDIPVDLETACRLADWRDRVWWPVGIGEANQICAAQVRGALKWVGALENDLLRDAALLALPNILAYGGAIVLLALAVSRASGAGARLVGAEPELAYLLTGEGPLPDRSAPILAPSTMRFELARRIARVRSWSGPLRTVAAFIDPMAVAISHNMLLRTVATGADRAIGFRHADLILDAARRRSGAVRLPAADAKSLALAILTDAVPDEPYRTRTIALLQAVAEPHLALAMRDIHALRSARLPESVWAGSGGLYAPRAIGIEVLRRGGQVVRYDHGKPKSFVEGCEIDALVEFAVSSEFVLATEGAAALARRHADESLLSWMKHPRIRGADGDPTFARLPSVRSMRPASGRPRVVYAPTQLLGFRQLLPVQQPDVIHLNWQLDVAEALQDLPVELTCQPHPEGLFKGRAHPLESVARSNSGHFDAQLQSADVFVFDYPSTTALWEAACTDARIVFLDIGAGKMTPEVATLFHERARVIEVEYDDGNRPVLDQAALRDAVLGSAGPVDNAPLRRLLAGTN